MLATVRLGAREEGYTPWVLGQPYPTETALKPILVIPESYLIRLHLTLPSEIVARPEALLYAVEPHLPTIEGRDVLMLQSQPSEQKGFYETEVLVYPRAHIELTLAMMPAGQSVAGVMTASDWWDITLPDQTALWVDDGVSAWVRLPSGLVYTVNSAALEQAYSQDVPDYCWIHHVKEALKGVIIYTDLSIGGEDYRRRYHWPEAIRVRTLPLTALYEAPRQHIGKWNLKTKKRWTASSISPYWTEAWKHRYLAAMGCLLSLSVLGLLYPVVYQFYLDQKDTSALRTAWVEQKKPQPTPGPIHEAWLDQIAKQPWRNVDRPPYFDPIGVWGGINRAAVGLALPELQSVRYEGNRWWLRFPKSLSLTKLAKFKRRLLGSGWKVETLEETDALQIVISAFWVK
jgi:hypothetical protein